MNNSRRKFLKNSGVVTGGIALSANTPLASALGSRVNGQEKDIVICVFQRGGADGLNSVVPHAESEYFNLRPQTAVNDSIDLDGFFGLNPDLAALKPIWDAGDLGIVHAVGSTSDSRSHFDAQDSMEYANFDKNVLRTGWLANYLSNTTTVEDSVFRAISLNDAIQKSIRGEVEALTISNINEFDIFTHESLYEDTKQGVEEMFQNNTHFIDTTSVLFSAIDSLKQLNPDDFPVDNGANYQDNDFADKLKTLGVIIKAGLGAEIICLDIGGWDHHNNIVDSFAAPAQSLSDGLLAFYQDMGERMQNITILCMTEFGRRVAENASLGTDHGHAGVMYAIGKQVNGGEVFSNWPGLQENDLNRGDLEVTTDFREVFSELLFKRLKYSDSLSNIIPNYSYGGGIGLFKSE